MNSIVKTLLRYLVVLFVYNISFLLNCGFFTFLFLYTFFFHGIYGLIGLFKKAKYTPVDEDEFVGKHFPDGVVTPGQVTTSSGVQLFYMESGKKGNPLMVCLHGFPECWYSWRHILTNFNDEYHVVAVNMRGYAKSSQPKGIGAYHRDYLARDVKELVEELGYKSAVIISHDWGGIIAWHIAAVYPHIVSKLVVMNAPQSNAFAEFIRLNPMKLMTNFWYMFTLQLPIIPELIFSRYNYRLFEICFNGELCGIETPDRKLTRIELDYYIQSCGPHFATAFNYYRALLPIYGGLGLRRKGNKISSPTLVIWGKDDVVLDYDIAHKTEKHVDLFRVKLIDNASHWVEQDQPEQVITAIKEFLQEQFE